MSQEFIEKLTLIVEANLSDENFGPEQLAEKLGISHSTLHRHLKKAANKTISRFIRDIRLEKACLLLLNEESTIAEVAYNVGFGSVTYFNRCFRERYRCAPGEYKKLEHQKSKPIKSQKKKIKNQIVFIAISSAIILLSLVFLTKFKKSSSEYLKEKTIAVMPFTFSGENAEKEYICNAVEDNIKSGLSKINDLTVVHVFRTGNESRVKIKKHVSYFLDGTVHQEANNNYMLAVKLVNNKNNHIEWSESYKLTNQTIYSTKSEVAQTVAKKLDATVSNEESLLIAKEPSIDPDASDFYQRGRAKHMEYWLDNTKTDVLNEAERYYFTALKRDSAFALAVAGLARVAYDKTSWSDIFNENYLDTVLSLADKALLLDSTLSDAYNLRGQCFFEKEPQKAESEFERALSFNPNDWQAYYGLARYHMLRNNIKSLEYLFEAAKRNRGDEYSLMLSLLVFDLSIYGLFEEAKDFNQRKLEWDDDSTNYFLRLSGIERYEEHYDKAIEYGLKAYKLNPSNIDIAGSLSFYFILKKDYSNALFYMNKAEQLSSFINFKRNNEHHRIGYVHLVNGDTLKANKYFETQIEASGELLKSSQDQSALYDLAATYAILCQKEKAYEILRTFKDTNEISWFFYVFMKDDPLFENMQNEAEFQQIFEEVKVKATKARDSLKTWFDQQGNI